MRELKLEFYVLNHDFNKDKIYNYNIFNNCWVYDHAIREAKRYLRNPAKYKPRKDKDLVGYEAFVKELDSIVMYEEWGRCEYEIAVGSLFTEDANKLEKWDCYQQFHPNRYIVADYVLKQVRKYQKEKATSSE